MILSGPGTLELDLLAPQWSQTVLQGGGVGQVGLGMWGRPLEGEAIICE